MDGHPARERTEVLAFYTASAIHFGVRAHARPGSVRASLDQVVFDPRNALFFPEKRPFFLDGLEQFATPNRLIYTRRIAAPWAPSNLFRL